MDSILKNIGGKYNEEFQKNLLSILPQVFGRVHQDDKNRITVGPSTLFSDLLELGKQIQTDSSFPPAFWHPWKIS
jgi:hypothetical protein